MTKIKAVFNWSGGKASCSVLWRALQSGRYEIVALLTTADRDTGRSTMHAIPEELLHAQAERIGIPLHIVRIPDAQGKSSVLSRKIRLSVHMDRDTVTDLLHPLRPQIKLFQKRPDQPGRHAPMLPPAILFPKGQTVTHIVQKTADHQPFLVQALPAGDLPGGMGHPVGMLQAVLPIRRMLPEKSAVREPLPQKGFCFLYIGHGLSPFAVMILYSISAA